MQVILFLLVIILNVFFTYKVLNSADIYNKSSSFIVMMVFVLQVLGYFTGSL